MSNEFGEDLNFSPSREKADKEKDKGRDGRDRLPHKFSSLAAGVQAGRDTQSGQRTRFARDE